MPYPNRKPTTTEIEQAIDLYRTDVVQSSDEIPFAEPPLERTAEPMQPKRISHIYKPPLRANNKVSRADVMNVDILVTGYSFYPGAKGGEFVVIQFYYLNDVSSDGELKDGALHWFTTGAGCVLESLHAAEGQGHFVMCLTETTSSAGRKVVQVV